MTKPIRLLACAAAASSVLALGISGLPGHAAPSDRAGARGPRLDSPDIRARGHQVGLYDARRLPTRSRVRATRRQLNEPGSAYRTAVRLGRQVSVDIDPLTGTPRELSRTNGYLTPKTTASPRRVALRYVRHHLGQLGLRRSDLSTFTLRRHYRDSSGIRHLYWTQSVRAVPVYGNGLKVNIDRDGRIISIQGSPVADLRHLAASSQETPAIGAAAARADAAADVNGRVHAGTTVRASEPDGGMVWSNRDFARPVWFLTPTGLRLGWSTYVQTGPESAYQHVIDASTGRVLLRQSTVDFDRGGAYVYDYYPGAAHGGQARVVNLIRRGWLPGSATFLDGRDAIAWTDTNDDNVLNSWERTTVPGDANGATFALQPFVNASGRCSPQYVCTWKPSTAFSWRTNRIADATQAFYLASTYHDYLAKAPIGFTAQAGNFEASGGDPVLINALDGADTAAGLPDGNHVDNANMSTPPDGVPPTMQMYLWHAPGATDTQDPFIPTSSAFDASIELHEYTHGLSSRLVTDPAGDQALNSIESAAMGEGWSDYYAMDYLTTSGFVTDTPGSGEVFLGTYLTAGAPFRTMAIDCAVGATSDGCTDDNGGRGGYTYGDFPTISRSGPEVHASSEVWSQTLWDIRGALGHDVADTLITRAMSLSPTEPSMLDMRDAILQADQAVYGNAHRPVLWRIFANRGMGWYAGAVDGSDAFPAEDFQLPPAPVTLRTAIVGEVTDPSNGNRPVVGAVVHVTGHDSGFLGDYTAVTGGTGRYRIPNVFPGTYPKVVAEAPGYEPASHPVDTADPTAGDFSLRRDWAAYSGGATITGFNGPDNSVLGCGPIEAIDTSLGTGWGSTTGDDNGTPTNQFVPKFIVVDLQHPVDISGFAVDPSNTCVDDQTSATGRYEIDTSPDGTTWTTAAQGAFATADIGRLNAVSATAGVRGVRFVRFWMLGNQVPSFDLHCPTAPVSGCSFTDLTELEVHGAPAG
jgi:extracellular elastinolytic metalloproteinase